MVLLLDAVLVEPPPAVVFAPVPLEAAAPGEEDKDALAAVVTAVEADCAEETGNREQRATIRKPRVCIFTRGKIKIKNEWLTHCQGILRENERNERGVPFLGHK